MLGDEATANASLEQQSPVAPAATGKKQKRFKCQRCDRLFARLEHLQRHERIHTQEKPFVCRQCSYSFTRSDLLIRHERLTHDRASSSNTHGNEQTQGPDGSGSNKRRRATISNVRTNQEMTAESPRQPANIHSYSASTPGAQGSNSLMNSDQNDQYSLAALSMAAEYSALQGPFPSVAFQEQIMTAGPVQSEPLHAIRPALGMSQQHHSQGYGFEESLDSLAAFLDNEPISAYHFSSLMSAEQALPPFFSPESYTYASEYVQNAGAHTPAFRQTSQHVEEPNNGFSRFGSRLPSLQPEENPDLTQDRLSARHQFSEVSFEDRQNILADLAEFSSVVPADFQLPSRLALSRYVAAYVNGFHEHLPFLHLPTMLMASCSIELILAMAAVGAQYCFEGERGVELFNTSQAIAVQRIRRRDARLVSFHRRAESEVSTATRGMEESPGARTPAVDSSSAGPLGLPSEPEISSSTSTEKEDLIQTAQALLILMAMATWAKHKEILREALAIQSILATLIRDDGLQSQPQVEELSWEDWVHLETVKRTKLIVFCFFNLHCIVYNIPPLILNSEVKLTLPSGVAEFKATTAAGWREARKKRTKDVGFQEAFRQLFSRTGRDNAHCNSSLGNYVLIHALIQHIFFVRQVAKCRFEQPGDLTSDDISTLEHALRNWQLGWKRNPESSLDPMDPNGPVAFNSTALLRLAYIRLNVDTGPGRALDTRDPLQIARAFRDSPAIKRTPKLVRAVLHSAHALSVPVKIGVRLVAKTQTFIWSIQHSLCSLECAFLLSKWLEALSLPNPEPPITEDERRIRSLVKTMLDETEFGVPQDMPLDSPATSKCLSAGVLRVWATIFRGAQTWAIVDVIGSSLNIYADMLEPN